MNRPRLEHLITVMQRVADQSLPFDMGSFSRESDDGPDCGTTFCVAGWACQDAEFQRQGLKVRTIDRFSFPSFQGRGPWGSLSLFFGVDSDKLYEVFSADNAFSPATNTPQAAIERIRRLLATEA